MPPSPRHAALRVTALSALLAAAATTLACGAAAQDDPEPDAAGVPLREADFDCRATAPPAPPSAVPLDCIIDPTCTTELVTAHRGAGGVFALYAPENSLSALRVAILLGADAAEVDVRDTLDGGLVLMHDSSALRTTGVDTEIDTLTLAEATALPLLSEDFPAELACETVPDFSTVLALAKDRINLIVDTKTGRADRVAEAIRDAGMLDQAFVSVSDAARAVQARAAVPEVRVQIRPDSLAAYEAMIAGFDRHPEIVEVPYYDLAEFADVVAAAQAKLFADCFVQDAFVVFEGDTDKYLDLYDDGANVLQTEFPAWALEALGRSLWSELPPHRDIGLDSPLL